MRLSALLFRRIHKWIGLILGLQFVLWTLSGAVMAVLDMETVAGGPRPAAAAAGPLPASGQAWTRIRQTLGGAPITALATRPLLGRHALEVSTAAGPRLFEAETGEPIIIDAATARRIAEAGYAGAGRVKRVRLLAAPTLAIREHPGPAWQIDFADPQNSSFYVSQASGKLLERRNDAWRLWDFAWMLHNMDYANRSSFNHPLIVLVGFGIAWLALTGFWLLFRTAWRPDLRALRSGLRAGLRSGLESLAGRRG
jgi:hypothetical protein